MSTPEWVSQERRRGLFAIFLRVPPPRQRDTAEVDGDEGEGDARQIDGDRR